MYSRESHDAPLATLNIPAGQREYWILLALGTIAVGIFPPILGGIVLAIVVAAAWRWPVMVTAASACAAFALRPSLDALQFLSVGGVNPAAGFGLLLLCIGVVIGLRRWLDGQRLWPDRLFAHSQVVLVVLHVILLGVALRSGGGGALPVAGREFLRFAGTLAAGMLLVWWIMDEPVERRRAALVLLIAGSIVPICVGFYQAVSGEGIWKELDLNRVYGTFTHPLTYGSFLLPLSMLGLAAAIRRRGAIRAAAIGLLVTSLVLLVLTYNRTTLILVVCAAGVFLVRQFTALTLGRALAYTVPTVLLLAIAWLVAGDVVLDRFSGVAISTAAIQEALVSGSQNSFQWRIVNWAILIQLGLSEPVFGHGLGMTSVLNPLINLDNGVPFNAHNDYVRYFFEGGLIGLTLHTIQLGLLGLWIWRTSGAVRGASTAEAHAIAASLLALFLLSAGTTEMSLQTGVLYQVYLLLGILAALRERTRVGQESRE